MESGKICILSLYNLAIIMGKVATYEIYVIKHGSPRPLMFSYYSRHDDMKCRPCNNIENIVLSKS